MDAEENCNFIPMSYVDSSKIQAMVLQFLKERNNEKYLDLQSSSFFEGKMNDLGRDFENGKLKQEAIPGEIENILNQFTMYLDASDKRELEKAVKQLFQ